MQPLCEKRVGSAECYGMSKTWFKPDIGVLQRYFGIGRQEDSQNLLFCMFTCNTFHYIK